MVSYVALIFVAFKLQKHNNSRCNSIFKIVFDKYKFQLISLLIKCLLKRKTYKNVIEIQTQYDTKREFLIMAYDDYIKIY